MEIYRNHKKNTKYYKKINYTKLLLVFVICFSFLSLFFYYIGKEQNLSNSIVTSLIITFLLCLGSIIGDLIGNRNRIFVINKDKIGYIEIHKDDQGAEYLKEIDYNEIVDKYGVEEIYNHNNKYEGIDSGIIKDIIYIKKKYNRIVLKASVEVKEWKSSSWFFISKLYLIDRKKTKKMIIPIDYDNYEKLYQKLEKKKK